MEIRRKSEKEVIQGKLENLSRKNRYQEIVSEVTQCAHESIDLQTVLDNSVLALIRNVDKLDIAAIYLVEGKTLVLKSNKGFTEDYLQRAGRIPYPKGATWKTVIDKKSLYVPDIDYDEELGQAGKDMGFQCYLIVPLIINSEVVGTIAIVSYEKNVFDHEELKLLELVSKQISIAIKNAQQAKALIESTEELKKSRERFRLLLETTNVIPWEAEADTLRYTYVGPQVEKLLGYPAGMWYEEGFREAHTHENDRDRTAKEYMIGVKSRKDFFLEYRMVSMKGDIVWIYETVSVIGEKRKPKHLRGYMLDITKRKQAEELATQLGKILEESVTEVLIADVETMKFVEVNEEARKSLGYTMEELRKLSVFDVKTEFSVKDFNSIADSLLSGKIEKAHFTTTQRRKDGTTYPVEVYMQLSTLRGRKVFVANIQDISERKRAHNLLMSEKNILEMISVGKELNDILENICLTVEKLTDNMLCSFLLLDETGTLKPGASPSLPGKYVNAIDNLPVGYGIGSCGTAAFLKEQVIVSDIATDPFWADFRELALSYNLRACWSTPILSGNGDLLGTFGMYYSEQREPVKEEFELIERATQLARIAIERENSLKHISRKSKYDEIISSVTTSVHSSLDLKDVLDNAVKSMHEKIKNADNVGIFFIEGDLAVNKAHSGYPKAFLEKVKKIPKPKGFTWETIMRGELLYCSDAESDMTIGPAGKKVGTKSYAGMPIKIGEESLGCININSYTKDAFDQEEIKLLEIVAQQIAVAINNATQAEELKKSQEKLKENLKRLSKKTKYEVVINAVSRSVHQSLELDDVFNNAVEAISREIEDANNVVIYMVEGDMGNSENPPVAVLKASWGYNKKYLKRVSRVPHPVGATWKTIIDGKKRYVPDIDKGDTIGPAGREFGTKSYISVPLNNLGKTVGCIHIHSYEKNSFSEDDLKLLEIVTRQLETAIINASKAEALRKSEESLTYNLEQLSKKNRYEEIINTVSSSVHQSLEIDEVFKNAAFSLSKNVEHSDHVAIYMTEGDEAVLKSFTGYPKWFTDKVARIPKPKGLTWKTILGGKPHFSTDTNKDNYIGPAGIKAGTKSYASMPIKDGPETIGCINISSRTLNTFSEEEIRLLQIVAGQIETAINNAKQAEALKASREELRESREHFRLLVETTNVIPWEFDVEMEKFTYVGPQAEELLGFPIASWLEKDFWPTHIHKDDKHVIEQCFIESTALKDHELEYRMISKDGKTVWIYEMVTVIAENGNPKTLRGFLIDDTERKKAEEALNANLEQISKKNRYEEISNTVIRAVHKSIDLDEVLENTVDVMIRNIEVVDHVSIYFVEGDVAAMKAHKGYPEWFLSKIKTIPYPKGFTWECINRGEIIFCPDVEKDGVIGPAGVEVGTKSYMAIPIKDRDKTIGSLNVHSLKKNAFDDEDISLLEVVGKQIEIAINQSRDAQALRYSEERFRTLYQEGPSMYFTVNEDGTVLSVNLNGIEKLGYSEKELIGNSVYSVFLEKDVPKIKDQLAKCFENPGEIFRWELRKVCKDGKIISVSELARCVMDPGGIKVALIVCEDITERKKAEEDKREAEERYRTLIEHSYDIIVETNTDGEILYSNPTFNEALGYEQSELLGRSIFEHIHNEDRRNAISQFSKAIDQFRKGTATYRFKHKSGEWRWLESIAGPFLTADIEKRAVISSRDITERMESEKKLQEAFSEIETLKDQLEKENVYLRKEIGLSYSHSDIIGQSKVIKKVLSKIEQVASTDATVLLTGETGTGKELFANRIHNLSKRKDRAIVMVNCAALPPNLIESELFGHEKGAFTGAVTKNIGRFEVADCSTLFLDEVGELPSELQSKLLRVLQEGEFQRVGSSKTIQVDVRVVAATNQNLLEAVNNGRFREDLYYRLNVFPVSVPPLRERKEDIADLLWFYISEFERKMDKTIKNISRKDMENLINYPWPGNVRQLRNIIERAMIISTGPDLEIELPGIRSQQAPSEMKPIEDVERDHISYILNMTNWRIRGKSGAAEILGLKPTTLESRIKRLGIKRGH